MTRYDESPTLEEIPLVECLELIAMASIGRFAVSQPDEPPLVVPVNFVLDDQVIVFRSNPGSKMSALRRHPASFQVDLIDPIHHTGWSVLVQGIAYEAARDEVEHLLLSPWVGEREHWVRLIPSSITGRRITLPELTIDGRGYL